MHESKPYTHSQMAQCACKEDVYDETMYKQYFELQNSSIFQDYLRYTVELNLPDLRGKRAYDVGSGAGFNMEYLLGKGLSEYIGLDLSPVMFSHLAAKAKELDLSTPVQFVQGDNTEPRTLVPYDFVISSYAMYCPSYEKLQGYAKHLSSALAPNGELILMVIHADYVHEQSRLDVLAKNDHYITPVLPLGESYAEFSAYQIKHHILEFTEYVVSQPTLIRALTEAGFSSIVPINMVAKPGPNAERLEEFGRAFGLGTYKCKK